MAGSRQTRHHLDRLRAEADTGRQATAKAIKGLKPPKNPYANLAYWEELADVATERAGNALIEARGLEPQPSYSELAAILGVTGPAVSSRLRTLTKEN